MYYGIAIKCPNPFCFFYICSFIGNVSKKKKKKAIDQDHQHSVLFGGTSSETCRARFSHWHAHNSRLKLHKTFF